jgi:hypothetical protein
MPAFNIYQQANFPPVFRWQAVSFMRCEWPSIFQEERTLRGLPRPHMTANLEDLTNLRVAQGAIRGHAGGRLWLPGP